LQILFGKNSGKHFEIHRNDPNNPKHFQFEISAPIIPQSLQFFPQKLIEIPRKSSSLTKTSVDAEIDIIKPSSQMKAIHY
jgi:hypothetical protein